MLLNLGTNSGASSRVMGLMLRRLRRTDAGCMVGRLGRADAGCMVLSLRRADTERMVCMNVEVWFWKISLDWGFKLIR